MHFEESLLLLLYLVNYFGCLVVMYICLRIFVFPCSKTAFERRAEGEKENRHVHIYTSAQPLPIALSLSLSRGGSGF